jgi:dolichyl-diphosphooligosaccharide--protein glycosyltransferase
MPHLENQLHRPNYVLVFVAGERSPSAASGQQGVYTFTLQTPVPTPAGGDESKKQWFIRIGNNLCNCLNESKYLENDGFTLTPYFWQNSVLGKLFPFQPMGVYESYTTLVGATQTQPLTTYNATCGTNGCGVSNGWFQDLQYGVNYPSGNSTNPFTLVYQSPSLPASSTNQPFAAVMIYKVNYPST